MGLNDQNVARRNFGPRLDLMLLPDRVLPPRFRPAPDGFYAVVGGGRARQNNRHSRDYLRVATGRPAGIVAAWRHYRSLIASLHRKLRVAAGEPADFRILNPDAAADFLALAASGEPVFFGTFHVGDSDLLGFMLGEKLGRRVSMVRLRVGNSSDIDRLAGRFGDKVRLIWVNRPEDALLALKEAVMAGESVALQCDRPEHATRAEPFRFLGARRLFPFSIYHLALLFDRPVAFAFAMPEPDGAVGVTAGAVFRPDAGKSRDANLAAARAHFQGVLDVLEARLLADPMQWFNFTPLNTPVSETP